jgi:ABC-type polysaccharide/polyol phosphate transport system ATPase subunit
MTTPLPPAVDVDNVSLCYRVPHEKVGSFKEYAIRRLKRNLIVSDFWALRDVTFKVDAGEVFGIVGRNGAGKTTLLKVIARVLRPTGGRVVVRGLVAPLLGLGAGFNDELSGRENIFLSGATLGFSYRDMQARYDRIVEFAGLDEFIDAPLRTFSTGMRARLGFAIATDVEPDLLLLDEIMSVGDEEFRRRCKSRIESFRSNGATVVLVSHGLEMVSALCTRALFLDRGVMKKIGPTDEVVSEYTSTVLQPETTETAGSASD